MEINGDNLINCEIRLSIILRAHVRGHTVKVQYMCKNIMNMLIPHPLANLWEVPVERSLMKVWEVGKLAVPTDLVYP